MPPTAEALSGITGSDRSKKSAGRKMMKKSKMKRGVSAPKNKEQRDEKETVEVEYPNNATIPQPSATFNPFQSYLSQIENSFGVTSIENSSFVAAEVQQEEDNNNMEHVHASYGNHAAPTQFLPNSNASVTSADTTSNLYAIQFPFVDDHDEISTLGDESMLIRRGSKIGAPRTLWKEEENDVPQDDVEDYNGSNDNHANVTPPQQKERKRSQKKETVKKSNKSSNNGGRKKSRSPSQRQAKPDDVLEIPMDKSKSRSGSTFLLGLFSKSSGSDSRDEVEDDNPTPKSVDIYTTIGGGEEDCDPEAQSLGDDSTAHSISILQKNKWRIIYFSICLAIFLLAIAAVALTFSLLHAQENDEPLFENIFGGSDSDNNPTPQMPSQNDPFPPAFAPLVATDSPTLASVVEGGGAAPTPLISKPQAPPTLAPTVDPMTDIKVDMLTVITENSAASLMDMEPVVYESSEGEAIEVLPDTPQVKAYQWMINDPSYWSYTNATKLQRWVLAVFYYSTDGDNWRRENFPSAFQLGKAPWLNYSSECHWESTNKGTNGDICNDPILANTNTTDSDATLPHADIFALHLRTVGLNGTIPTELSLLTSLRIIFANGNAISGTIPTEMG
ncbi:MAG: hypothetical protein SGILL_002992 [Bacillariaceae sp.]